MRRRVWAAARPGRRRGTGEEAQKRLQRPRAGLRSPWLVVGMTSLPSRLGGIGPALQSIAAQDRRPDRLVLSLPRLSEREQRAYELPTELVELLRAHPWMEVHWVDGDMGPGTKLLGALDWLATRGLAPRDGDTLMVLDDDHEYLPHALGDLLRELAARGGREVVTYFAYFMRGLMVPQGADVIAFPLGAEALGERVRPYHRDFVVGDRNCFLVDDLWIGMFLHLIGKPVASLRELVTSRGLQMIYRRTENAKVAALEALSGEDRRDRVTLRAFDGLLSRLLAAGAAGLAPYGGAAALHRLRRLEAEVQQAEARIQRIGSWLASERSAGRCSPELVAKAEAELAQLRHLYEMQAPPSRPPPGASAA